MNAKLLVLATLFSCAGGVVLAEKADRYVRVAELEIDPAQADAFTTAIREVGQASVRSEDGCLVLYAVAEKQDPARVRVFEIYRDPAAYQAHLLTPRISRSSARRRTRW